VSADKVVETKDAAYASNISVAINPNGEILLLLFESLDRPPFAAAMLPRDNAVSLVGMINSAVAHLDAGLPTVPPGARH